MFPRFLISCPFFSLLGALSLIFLIASGILLYLYLTKKPKKGPKDAEAGNQKKKGKGQPTKGTKKETKKKRKEESEKSQTSATSTTSTTSDTSDTESSKKSPPSSRTPSSQIYLSDDDDETTTSSQRPDPFTGLTDLPKWHHLKRNKEKKNRKP